MSVDIFGRQLGEFTRSHGHSNTRGPPGIGFKLTADNQFDIDEKRLCNIGDPVDENDAISLKVFKN